MSRSVPRNIDHKGEHLSQCDVCGVMYLRSALRRGRDGLLRCENDRDGRDELTLAELTAARASSLSLRLGSQAIADGARPDTSPTRTPEEPFVPTDISAVSAWLSVADATHDSNGVSSLPDLMNSNPAVQSVDARKPVIELSANALPCMRFATNDVLRWPVTPANTTQQTWGIAFWFKPNTLTGVQMLFAAFPNTGGTNVNRLRLYVQSNGLTCEIIASGNNGRFLSAASSISTDWQHVTFEYDASGATEALKATVTINGIVKTVTFGNQGAGAAIGNLVTVTGNLLFGDHIDGTASFPFNGLIGPNIYAFSSKMAGATQGLLTAAARTSLMAYHNPTVVTPIPVAPRLPEDGLYTGPTRRLTVADVYNNEIPTYGNPYTAVNKPGF